MRRQLGVYTSNYTQRGRFLTQNAGHAEPRLDGIDVVHRGLDLARKPLLAPAPFQVHVILNPMIQVAMLMLSELSCHCHTLQYISKPALQQPQRSQGSIPLRIIPAPLKRAPD
jgi:hypothetical protein